jgi:hypothetical protein
MIIDIIGHQFLYIWQRSTFILLPVRPGFIIFNSEDCELFCVKIATFRLSLFISKLESKGRRLIVVGHCSQTIPAWGNADNDTN